MPVVDSGVIIRKKDTSPTVITNSPISELRIKVPRDDHISLDMPLQKKMDMNCTYQNREDERNCICCCFCCYFLSCLGFEIVD